MGKAMSLQTGTDAMITHPLSSVYGSYVITQDGAPVHVTANAEYLYQQLEGLSYADAARVRVLIVSSEDWATDDITEFVWEVMAEHYAGTTNLPRDWDEWVETIGHPSLGFIQFGYDEFNPNQERTKRKAKADACKKRFARFRDVEPVYAVAAE